jgi:hypothetical protein
LGEVWIHVGCRGCVKMAIIPEKPASAS